MLEDLVMTSLSLTRAFPTLLSPYLYTHTIFQHGEELLWIQLKRLTQEEKTSSKRILDFAHLYWQNLRKMYGILKVVLRKKYNFGLGRID